MHGMVSHARLVTDIHYGKLPDGNVVLATWNKDRLSMSRESLGEPGRIGHRKDAVWAHVISSKVRPGCLHDMRACAYIQEAWLRALVARESMLHAFRLG